MCCRVRILAVHCVLKLVVWIGLINCLGYGAAAVEALGALTGHLCLLFVLADICEADVALLCDDVVTL